MNPQRDAMSEVLRELAGASPEASPEVGARLREAFTLHHVRRRMRQRVAVGVGLVACLAVSTVLLHSSNRARTVKMIEPTVQNTTTSSSERKVVAPESPRHTEETVIAKAAMKPRSLKKQVKKLRAHNIEALRATVAAADFVALPTFDPAIPTGQSRIVRIDLPGSALQLIGYPVEGQLLDRRILTDVLVGQDGMPYAVRLVQSRNVH